MSDDKSPLEKNARPEPVSPEVTDGAAIKKASIPAEVVMGLVIIALLGLLIITMFNKKSNSAHTPTGVAATDLKGLQAEVDARRTELNRQRQAMGLSPVEGTSEPIEEIANRLKRDSDSLVALSVRFQQMLTEKDAEIGAANSKLLRSEQTRTSLATEITTLRADLQRALVGGSDADLLRRDMLNLKSQRDALSEELTKVKLELKSMGTAVSTDDFADLKRRFEETLRAKDFFEARVKELEGDLSKAKLFASSETELLPAAVALFRGLRGLEGLSDSDITTSYSGLGVELGANVLHTLTFPTGAATLTPEDENAVRNLTADLPDGDLLFVVGYASKTGNVNDNEKLSSDRATAVAQYYTGTKRPGQLVQAVYLGQTDRFSSRIPERNQIVEIWRIRKK